ncbi:MAG: FliH/SctL family protein [Gemmatimonadales bacterium]
MQHRAGGATVAWSPDDFTLCAHAEIESVIEVIEDDPAAQAVAARERELADSFALGFEQGRHEGTNSEAARLRFAVRATTDALQVIEVNEGHWRGTIEENIAALSVAVARHIVDREIKTDRDVVLRLVRRALAEFRLDQSVRIRLNPNDLALIEEHDEQALVMPIGGPARDAHWISDPRIAAGGCSVEGRDRIIDGRVDTALERAYRRLTYQNA